MKQSRLESFIETSFSTALGFLVSFTAWPFVAAMHGIPYGFAQTTSITLIFTVLSLLRSYVVRRWFANELHLAAKHLAIKIIAFMRSWNA